MPPKIKAKLSISRILTTTAIYPFDGYMVDLKKVYKNYTVTEITLKTIGAKVILKKDAEQKYVIIPYSAILAIYE